MAKLINLIGKKFGKLIVIKKTDKNKWGNYYWLCKCDCGKEKIIRGNNLKSGVTKSCGCLNIEKIIERFTTHGQAKTKTYKSWADMIQRCTNPKHKRYKDYGSRGITVCKRWQNSFVDFLEDMGESPEGCSIDRINNNKGYKKSNCKWSTRKEQMRNKRSNHLETYNGKIQCIAEWSEEVGISYDTLWKRIFRYGWSIEKALTTPVQKRRRQKK
ncbi:hypothetical protein LCGC14_1286380 [marine sediment metagenome]|uniref:AP2 domain-containing protein n=1 Tax=marine sediment metagenome TaxID=412755 RepID=A0A0F9LEM5_9ZZZZ